MGRWEDGEDSREEGFAGWCTVPLYGTVAGGRRGFCLEWSIGGSQRRRAANGCCLSVMVLDLVCWPTERHGVVVLLYRTEVYLYDTLLVVPN